MSKAVLSSRRMTITTKPESDVGDFHEGSSCAVMAAESLFNSRFKEAVLVQVGVGLGGN